MVPLASAATPDWEVDDFVKNPSVTQKEAAGRKMLVMPKDYIPDIRHLVKAGRRSAQRDSDT